MFSPGKQAKCNRVIKLKGKKEIQESCYWAIRVRFIFPDNGNPNEGTGKKSHPLISC